VESLVSLHSTTLNPLFCFSVLCDSWSALSLLNIPLPLSESQCDGISLAHRLCCKAYWYFLYSLWHESHQINFWLLYISDWGGQCLLCRWWSPCGASPNFTTRRSHCELHMFLFLFGYWFSTWQVQRALYRIVSEDRNSLQVGTIDSVMGLPKALTEKLIKESLSEP